MSGPAHQPVAAGVNIHRPCSAAGGPSRRGYEPLQLLTELGQRARADTGKAPERRAVADHAGGERLDGRIAQDPVHRHAHRGGGTRSPPFERLPER